MSHETKSPRSRCGKVLFPGEGSLFVFWIGRSLVGVGVGVKEREGEEEKCER